MLAISLQLRGIITPVRYNTFVRLGIIAAAVLAAACTPIASASATAAPPLQPYFTITPSATLDQVASFVVSADTPFPSPTPSQYAIRSGDTLSQIAKRFGIPLATLIALNKIEDPNRIEVGMVLKLK